MPMLEKPPVSPEAQAQMGPPGGPNFGPGAAQAQQKSPAEVAVATVEKLLMGVPGDTFRTYAQRAIAILKVGMAMEQKQGPQSQGSGMGMPPQGATAGGPPSPPMPPVAGPMPG